MIPLRALAPLGYAAVALATIVGLYTWGARNERQACQAEQAESLRRAIEQADEIARQDAELLAGHEVRAERVRTVFRNLDREVIRYVQAQDGRLEAGATCLDADGVRLWAGANAGTDPEAPAGRADDSLSGDSAPSLGPGGGSVAQPPGDGAGIPPVPGAGAELDGVGGGDPLPVREGIRSSVIPIYAVERLKSSPALGGGPR